MRSSWIHAYIALGPGATRRVHYEKLLLDYERFLAGELPQEPAYLPAGPFAGGAAAYGDAGAAAGNAAAGGGAYQGEGAGHGNGHVQGGEMQQEEGANAADPRPSFTRCTIALRTQHNQQAPHDGDRMHHNQQTPHSTPPSSIHQNMALTRPTREPDGLAHYSMLWIHCASCLSQHSLFTREKHGWLDAWCSCLWGRGLG